jgi:hypothetical protein
MHGNGTGQHWPGFTSMRNRANMRRPTFAGGGTVRHVNVTTHILHRPMFMPKSRDIHHALRAVRRIGIPAALRGSTSTGNPAGAVRVLLLVALAVIGAACRSQPATPTIPVTEDTYAVVKRVIPEGKTMCSLCSRLRRGALYSFASENGLRRSRSAITATTSSRRCSSTCSTRRR